MDTSLFEHEKWNNGWQTRKSAQGVTHLIAQYQHSRYSQDMDSIPEELLMQEMAYKLAKEILESDSATIYKNLDQETFNETIYAEICIAPPGMKYVNRDEEVFQVDDELFTNEELIEAVKGFYAERFI